MLLIYWVVFFLAVAETGIQLLVPPYLVSTGVATAGVGFLMALLASGRLGSRLIGAHLYGRESRRLGLLASLGAVSVTALPFALPLPAAVSGVLLFLHGLSYGLATTMTLALCMERIVRPADAPVVMGWYTGFTSGGHFIGAVVAGYLADHVGLDRSFVAVAVTTSVALPLTAFVRWPDLVRKGRVVVPARHGRHVGPPAPPSSAGVQPGPGPGPDGSGSDGTSDPGAIAFEDPPGRRPRLAGLIFALPASVYLAVLLAFYINFLNQMTSAFYPIFALQMGLSLTIVGALKGAYSGAGTVVRLVLGMIFKHIDYKKANYASLIVLACGTAMLAVVNSVYVLFPIFLILGISRGVLRATSATFAAGAHMTSSRRRGLAAGVYNAGLDVGSILGPVVGGVTVAAFGLRSVFWVPALLMMIPGLVLAVRVGRKA